MLLALVLCFVLFKNYAIIVVVGLLLAVINFVLNALTVIYAGRSNSGKIVLVLGAAFRMIITAATAVYICSDNIRNLPAFLVGYSLHYLAVLMFGISRKTMKGRKEINQ